VLEGEGLGIQGIINFLKTALFFHWPIIRVTIIQFGGKEVPGFGRRGP